MHAKLPIFKKIKNIIKPFPFLLIIINIKVKEEKSKIER